MSFEAWTIFVSFWALFVTAPGPNALNCITVALHYGFNTALFCVLAILTQASLFLTLSAFGITALIAASPFAFDLFKWLGAGFLIYLGLRGWISAAQSVAAQKPDHRKIYIKAFMIATINPKSIAGYLAAFSQFVQPDIPIWAQMGTIFPTALCLTTCSYLCYCAIGAKLGHAAINAVFSTNLRRLMALFFVCYGVLLGSIQMGKGV
jgi:homoserine/homoserine lactone efflux protein